MTQLPYDATRWFEQADRRDPRGEHIQNVLIFATIACMPLGTAPLAIMTLVTFVHAILRSWAAVDTCRAWIREPLIWIMAAWTAWIALSLLWSPDVDQGLDELAITRLFLPLIFALWPGVRRMHRWFDALAIGVTLAACIQIMQRFAPQILSHELWWHDERIAGRYPGLLHPMLTGLLAGITVVAMLGIVLAPDGAGVSPGRRMRSGFFLVMAAIGLLLTGSRAPLLAAIAGALAAVVLVLVNRRRSDMERVNSAPKRLVGLLALVAIPVVIALAIFLGPQWTRRVSDALAGIDDAIVRRDYSNDVAARVRQAQISFGLWQEHPILGVGAGGYLVSARQWLMVQESSSPDANAASDDNSTLPRGSGVLSDPHSSLLYALSVLGLPGVILFTALWIVLLAESWRARCVSDRVDPMHPFNRIGPALVLLVGIAFILDDQIFSSPGAILLSILVMMVMRARFLRSPTGVGQAS